MKAQAGSRYSVEKLPNSTHTESPGGIVKRRFLFIPAREVLRVHVSHKLLEAGAAGARTTLRIETADPTLHVVH